MQTSTHRPIVSARLVIVLLAVCLIAGAAWYGFSTDQLHRLWRDLLDRPSGPMAFRILLQPLMATIAAVMDGIRDAKAGRPPYLWTILSEPGERRELLSEGIEATARVIFAGLVIDTIYQFVVLNTFYPGEAAIVAILLCFLPYLLLRGVAARFHYLRHGTRPANSKTAGPAAGQTQH